MFDDAPADLWTASQVLHDAGLTVKDVAALMGVAPGTVGRWLRGTRRPPPELAPALEELGDAHLAGRIMSLIPQGGCPACRDTRCVVPSGQCHRVGCAESVRARPGMYCSLRCAALAQQRNRGGGIVEQTGRDGRTYRRLRFTAYGKRQHVSLGAVSREDAEQELGQVLADVDRGAWRPEGDRRGEAITRRHAESRAEFRAQLRVETAGCRNPACQRTSCEDPFGQCHHPGCQEPATIARQSNARLRHVRGEPTLYCSRHRYGPRVRAVSELRALGLLTGEEAAEKVGLTSLRDGRLVPFERVNKTLTGYAPQDVDRYRRELRERVRRARSGVADRRTALPFDPDYVVQRWRAAGWLALYATNHGVGETEAETILRARVKARSKLIMRGRPTQTDLRGQLLEIAREVIDEHREIGDNLLKTSFLAEVGLLAWQRDLSDFRTRYPAGRSARDDPASPARGWRKAIVDRVDTLIGDDAKALLIATV
ncbi:MAG: helix-turn-helix domain-containing protein [Solirubrobacteraceae bacterium]